jgi:type IV pilus assembly protein PilW
MRVQRGFSLIELMISLVFGLVILGALVALISGTSRANREMATANSVIENGRFAIQLLENDVVHGGFWGTYVPLYDDQTAIDPPPDVPDAVPDPCLAYSTANWNTAYVLGLLAIPVQVYAADAVDAGSSCEDVVTSAQPNSDVLVVRHADTCVAGAPNCEADTPDWLYFQSSLCTLECDDDPEVGRFVLDTTRTDPADDAAVFSLRRRDGVILADKRRFVSNIYYVRLVPTVNERNEAVTIPTLMRSSFARDPNTGALDHLAAVPLVEGVEAIRIELGVDDTSQTGAPLTRNDYLVPTAWQNSTTKEVATNRGDGMPDGLFELCTLANPCHDAADAFTLMNVTAVRIHVLARSREETQGYTDTKTYRLGNTAPDLGPYNDGFKRHVYTTTVRLPNISGRRLRP